MARRIREKPDQEHPGEIWNRDFPRPESIRTGPEGQEQRAQPSTSIKEQRACRRDRNPVVRGNFGLHTPDRAFANLHRVSLWCAQEKVPIREPQKRAGDHLSGAGYQDHGRSQHEWRNALPCIWNQMSAPILKRKGRNAAHEDQDRQHPPPVHLPYNLLFRPSPNPARARTQTIAPSSGKITGEVNQGNITIRRYTGRFPSRIMRPNTPGGREGKVT